MANLDEIQIKISQDSSDAGKSIDSLIDSLEKLSKASDIGKTAGNINGLSGSLKTLTSAAKNFNIEGIAGKVKDFSMSAFGTLKSLAGWGVSLSVIGKQLADSTRLASKYTQTVNMLNTVMGEGAEEAKEFAEELGDVLGLNPADVMNFQATFQNLFVGFGNNAKQAQIMSKNLTQLSYDMAAFYEQLGGDPQAAAEKLRLAMAGTIEPIQRLGYAIKEADLQAVAARQGLNVNIRNLNTASKSMLRYIAVMEQSNHVQGYMAKSFSSPTTAMMVYQSAIKQLSTEIGKTFLPMLMAAIPYIQAFVTGVLNMVKTINSILGIELPTIEGWDETKEGISGIGDEATETGKKIQKAFTLGIDELNVLDSSAADAGAGMQDITGQLKLPEYNMLEGFSGDKVKEIQSMLEPLAPLFEGMAIAFAGFYDAVSWLGSDVFYPWLVSIGEWMKENPDTMWLIGQGLGYIGAGLLTLKVLGGLGSVLGLPNLFKKMGEGMKSVYEKAGKKLAPTLKTLALRLAGVAALTLSVYGAMQIAKTVIDIKNGDVQGWEAFRQIIGWTAITIGSLTIGLFALGVAGVSVAAALAGAMAIALGAVLLNWDDFALRIQVSAAYISRFVWTVFAGLGAALLTIFETLGMLVAEAIQGVVWLALKGIELFSENVLKNVKSVAEIADKILGTQFASKITTELDLTSGIEKRMSDVMNSYTNSIKEVWGNVAEFATHDPYEDDYLQNAMAQYEAKQAKKSGKDDTSAIETIAKELKTAFGDYKGDVEKMTQDIEDLNGKQAEFADHTTEQIETQKITNEEITNLRSEIDALKMEQQNITMPDVSEALGESTELQTTANELAATANTIQTDYNATSLANDEEMQKVLSMGNTLQKSTTNDVISSIKNVGSNIVSALKDVEDACRNIKIEVHKYYGGGEGYASGGYPTSGEMFFAREDGMPEMVGRVGRQTAVMNNGQIADTMAQSLIRAMNQGGASQSPTVIENKLYLDGEVVYNNQQRIQRSKGYNLGMGVFANV